MPKVFRSLLLVLLLVLPSYSHAAATNEAEAVVQQLNEGLTQAMNGPADSTYAQREALLKPLMTKAFDYSYMAAVAIGRYWDKLPEDKRQQYVTLFEEVSIGAAADRFKPKPGTTFTLLSSREGPNGTRFVETELRLPKKNPRKIAYLLKTGSDGQWAVIDVFYEGTVSELATKRSEYSSIMKQSGIDGLIAKLSEKYRSYATD